MSKKMKRRHELGDRLKMKGLEVLNAPNVPTAPQGVETESIDAKMRRIEAAHMNERKVSFRLKIPLVQIRDYISSLRRKIRR